MSNCTSTGENIRRYREKKGISQSELARMLMVSQPTINQLEQDRKILTVPMARVIANALDCDVNALAGYQEHPEQ